jgi:hypothetical protein
VHTFHGHLLDDYFSPAVTRAVVTIERVLARRTERIVAVGEQVRDDLLERIGRREQYRVIPPGVRAGATPDRAAAKAMLRVEGPVVSSVGRLWHQASRPAAGGGSAFLM